MIQRTRPQAGYLSLYFPFPIIPYNINTDSEC
jgi:hypothetical protein